MQCVCELRVLQTAREKLWSPIRCIRFRKLVREDDSVDLFNIHGWQVNEMNQTGVETHNKDVP
jgi:hypothetical protein